MANILVRRNTSTGWHDENSLNSYQILRNDARFQGTSSNGIFLTKDNTLVGYRNKTFNTLNPPRYSGGTYYAKQYTYTCFIPEELKPYLNNPRYTIRRTHSMFVDEMVALTTRTMAGLGLEINEISGAIYGFPIRSKEIDIVVLDNSNKKYIRVPIKISVEPPPPSEDIGTKYQYFQIYVDYSFNRMIITDMLGNKWKPIPNLNIRREISDYSIPKYFQTGMNISISVDIDKQEMDKHLAAYTETFNSYAWFLSISSTSQSPGPMLYPGSVAVADRRERILRTDTPRVFNYIMDRHRKFCMTSLLSWPYASIAYNQYPPNW